MSNDPTLLPGRLTTKGTSFRDEHGRHVLLRGVNFGGDSKFPAAPFQPTYVPTDFNDHRTVSFIGHPVPLDEVDGHFQRLRHWGFNCLRLLTTWEAVEHAEPGNYDEAYLDYYAHLCRKAGQHQLRVIVDFHQDVWSRMSGGDGAPGWTFEAAGLDFTKFDAADAALLMQKRYDPALGGKQASYPPMCWAANSRLSANGIMWTLFFAGEKFAPSLKMDGLNIQTFLQQQYRGSMRAVAERVADLDHVIGFDTLNEPGSGWIEKRMDQPIGFLMGPAWTPLDCLAAASGFTRTVPLIEGGTVTGNASGTSLWLPGSSDPFRAAGAWGVNAEGEPVALDTDFFRQTGGMPVRLAEDCMLPFYEAVATDLHNIRADWLIFAEDDPMSESGAFPEDMPAKSVNASHWYDLATLVTKRFDPSQHFDLRSGSALKGTRAIEDAYVDGLTARTAKADQIRGGAPTLIGEFGIPYDLNEGEAYRRWREGERGPEVWHNHTLALTLMYNALDRLLLSATHWNYTIGNGNDPAVGDGWNQEDLSIWSADQHTSCDDPNSGGRAIEGFCRPFIAAAQGTIVEQRFEFSTKRFEAAIEVSADASGPTEVYVPSVQYPAGYLVELSNGEAKRGDQQLRVEAPVGRLRILISPAQGGEVGSS